MSGNSTAALRWLMVAICLSGSCAGPESDREIDASLGQITGLKEPTIRILLMDGRETCALEVSGPYEILGDQGTLLSGRRLPKTQVTVLDQQPARLVVGQRTCPPGAIRIVPQKPGSLQLHFQAGEGKGFSRRYDGSVIIRPRDAKGPSNGGRPARMDVINVVGIERYLVGVLSSELYPFFHPEAYRAQAVAARTFALFEMKTSGRNRSYDVRATERSQVYKGLEGFSKKSKAYQAVKDTRGVVCTWESPVGKKIFCTYYSSACGGVTQDAASCLNTPSIPPLAGGTRCTYCQVADPKYQAYRWKPVAISKSEVSAAVAKAFPEHAGLGQVSRITPVSWTADQRPVSLEIVGRNGKRARVSAYSFRLALGGHRIRSTHFKLVDDGDRFIFTDGRGFGHGVGMCQWGAEGQARAKRTAGEILAFYYPGSMLTRAY